jgi:hypothetical protein
VAASACDVDDLRPPEDRTPAPSGPSGSPAPGSDEELVERVASEIAATLGLVVVTRRQLPQLGQTTRSLARMHRTHLGVLDVEPPTETATSSPSAGEAALRQLRAAEQRLQQSLARASVAAGSGALARLLASMSAAVAQQLALLPTDLSPKDDR